MIRRVLASRPNAGAVESPSGAAEVPVPGSPPARPRWSPAEAFAWCETVVRSHHENFPVASRFVPADLRPYVWALYAFARTADDFADEPQYEGRRVQMLDAWEDQLEAAYHGNADHPVFVALAETVERRDIPISPLRDLLTAFRMDLSTARYPTWEAVRNYMQHSAAPVGQLILYIFDYRDPALHRYADEISIALELTHFIQDLASDVQRGRMYLPQEDLNHFGVSEADLRSLGAAHTQPARVPTEVRDLLRFQVARARALFQRGVPLTARVGRDLGFELSLIWQGGMTILDQIEHAGYDVFTRRPGLRTVDKVAMVMRSAARRWPALGGPRGGSTGR